VTTDEDRVLRGLWYDTIVRYDIDPTVWWHKDNVS